MRCFVPEFSRKLFLGLPISQITIFSYKPSYKNFFFFRSVLLRKCGDVIYNPLSEKRLLDSRSSEI